MSSSVSNFSFRYHPEDEQLDDNYEASSSISTTSVTVKPEGTNEEGNATGSPADVPTSVQSRVGVREETDKWKLFREVKGRIAKSVEEKIEEIKTERLKNQNQSKQRRSILGQMENSSISDSEEQSESSQPSASDKLPKSAPDSLTHSVKSEKTDEKLESDVSGSRGSTPDTSTTPVPMPDEILDDESDHPIKRGKGLKEMLRRKKGKTKNDKEGLCNKTTIAYSSLCHNDAESEGVEVAQEVRESTPEMMETRLARELDRLANPTVLQRLQTALCEWHMLVLPLVAFLLNWLLQLPQYMVGIIIGSLGLLMIQRFFGFVQEMLGSSESPIKQLKDMLPLTEVPIFRRSVYESEIADTKFEGWMNEYCREYNPETYHITLTESVFVSLEGSKLRLSSPRSKIPKRALWNEPRFKMLFNRQRLFDIANCRIDLKPDGLIQRRSWSKKYPICITLTPLSRLGVRYRDKNQDTIAEDASWIEEEKYNFDTGGEDFNDENTIPSTSVEDNLSDQDFDVLTVSSRLSADETLSVDSAASTDVELLRPLPSESELKNLDEDFVKITPAPQLDSLLFLFARTDREKEIWYRRLLSATKSGQKTKNSPSHNVTSLDYLNFMLSLSQRTAAHLPLTKEHNSKNHSSPNTADLSISLDMMWLNAFLGRVLFDVMLDPDKLVKIQEKIQRKLSAIKLPMFLEKLEVTHLDLGESVPIVQRATQPVLNSQGVWVDLDIVYEGGFKMTVDTKINMQRIKQLQQESPSHESPKHGSPVKASTSSPSPQPPEVQQRSAVYDSSVEDSAETSGDEPEVVVTPEGPVQQKHVGFLDKVAQSRYFQQVIDYKFIKKFVTGNNLQLIVEVKGLLGTLVLNIPPPPNDRLWYGFRTNPKLWLSAQPKIGQRAVHVISRIIEKKLCLEFQRILVLPNMDDLLIPVMSHTLPS